MKTNEDISGMVVVGEVINPVDQSRSSLILKSILMVIVGIILTVVPGDSLRIALMTIGVLIVVDAGVLFALALKTQGRMRRLCLVYGVLTLLAGVLTIAYPVITGFLWAIMIGVWQLINGVNMITAGNEMFDSGWFVFTGVISVITGVLFIVFPFTTFTAFVWAIGIVMIVSGVSLLLTALFSKKR